MLILPTWYNSITVAHNSQEFITEPTYFAAAVVAAFTRLPNKKEEKKNEATTARMFVANFR